MVTGNWVLRLFERIPNPPVCDISQVSLSILHLTSLSGIYSSATMEKPQALKCWEVAVLHTSQGF